MSGDRPAGTDCSPVERWLLVRISCGKGVLWEISLGACCTLMNDSTLIWHRTSRTIRQQNLYGLKENVGPSKWAAHAHTQTLLIHIDPATMLEIHRHVANETSSAFSLLTQIE